MRKKIIFIILLLFCFIPYEKTSNADIADYNSYARINVKEGRLLRDYTKDEINNYLNEYLSRRTFAGWKTHYLTRNAKVNFITDVLFSVYNDGQTSVDYTINVASETTTKTSISATGSIGYSLKGDIKKFKNGLDTSLKIENDYSQTELIKQQEGLVLHVDPQTLCTVYIQGEGLLTNGVARFYYFWLISEEGGYEYFKITNSYLKIEKLKI